jgi:CHAT domain-containing protein
MKTFTSLFWLLCIQVLVPAVLFSQKTLSKEIPAEFDSLIQVSRDYTGATEFEEAFATSAAAGKLAVACCGRYSEAFASYCFNEGRIRYFMGQNEAAIPWYVESKALRADLLGVTHPDYGKSLNNLAIVYDVMGRYAEAEPLYLEALEIREKTAGKESITYANALANLTGLYQETGNYEQAEIYGLQAKEIRERLLGPEHPDYGVSLVSLGNLYYLTNNIAKAQQSFLAAKAIYEQQEELDLYGYIDLLINLGALFQQLENYPLAEEHYQEAASLEEEYLGTDNAEYATILNSLAVVYEYTDRIPLAEKTLLQSLQILAALGQGNGLLYGFFSQNLADVHLKQGKVESAKNIQEKALNILEKFVDKSHPRYQRGLRSKAEIEQILNNYEAAAIDLRLLGELEQISLNRAIRHFSEDELSNYTEDFKQNLYRYFSLAAAYPELSDLCYDKSMVYKGLLLQTALQLNQLAVTNDSTSILFEQWRSLHRQLAVQYSLPLEDQQAIEKLEAATHVLEKELVRRTAKIGNVLQEVRWQEVQQQLNTRTAAVEFVHYRSDASDLGKPIKYAALVLFSNAPKPVFIPLFDQHSLDSLLHNESKTTPAFINALYSNQEKEVNALYQLIWEPIAAALAKHPDVQRIYYSPSGLLHRINIGAIPQPNGKQLARTYELIALGSTRQLVVPQSSFFEENEEPVALLYGGIEYGDMTNTSGFDDRGTSGIRGLTERSYSHQQQGYAEEEGTWQSLPWTEVEVMMAQDLLTQSGFSVETRMKTEATEASLKMLGEEHKSPALLHLATHGYFFPDPEEISSDDALAFRASERAMIRSGLILADGNYAWNYGHPREIGEEDGILTAYEVSKMNLRETELVVLSACETGLGEIKGTEGVYGLQRAFKIAGAHYLIMTLWQVPDFQTQAFMTTFYLAWLEEGKSIPEAFTAAQAYMRARYKDPFEWAAFILLE